jgi:hypothetical protein
MAGFGANPATSAAVDLSRMAASVEAMKPTRRFLREGAAKGTMAAPKKSRQHGGYGTGADDLKGVNTGLKFPFP